MKQAFRLREFFTRSKTKVEITVETKKTLRIKRQKIRVQQYCHICQSRTWFISPEETRFLFQSDITAVETLIAEGNLHFAESPQKLLMICFDSLKLEFERSIKT